MFMLCLLSEILTLNYETPPVNMYVTLAVFCAIPLYKIIANDILGAG